MTLSLAEPLVVQRGPGWLALAKPTLLPVFPPHDDSGGDCLLTRLLSCEPRQGEPAWPAGFSGGLAHRLDVATSGLVLAATSLASLTRLRAAFSQHLLAKHYLFLSRHDVPWDHHQVDLPLAHDRRHKARMAVQRGRNTPHRGRWYAASTTLRRLGVLDADGGPYTAWRATMHSGVMHQIRLHAAASGLALAGDALYGGGPPAPWARARVAGTEGIRAPFMLHHLGLRGRELAPDPLPPPAWWPELPWADDAPDRVGS